MARYLFLTWDGSGNQIPSIGAAQALRSRGHDVAFAGYESQRARISRHGFRFSVLERANARFQISPEGDILTTLVAGVWATPDHFDDLRDIVARETPDLLVIDCLMFGMLVAAERQKLPSVVLAHSAPGPLLPPGGPFEQFYLLDAINALRITAGLPSIASAWEQWARFPTLCATIPELDPMAAAAPQSFTYVGPLFEQMPPSGWQAPWQMDDVRPLVLVSFSAAGAWDQLSRIQRTLDGLGGQSVRVLVTVGTADIATLTIPANAIIVPFIPHMEVLPQTAAVVTHGGHGTITAALAHGIPLVCLPNKTSDQPMLAAQVASLGAGIALDGDDAVAADIGAAVMLISTSPTYTVAARWLAAIIKNARPSEATVAWLEHWLRR